MNPYSIATPKPFNDVQYPLWCQATSRMASLCIHATDDNDTWTEFQARQKCCIRMGEVLTDRHFTATQTNMEPYVDTLRRPVVYKMPLALGEGKVIVSANLTLTLSASVHGAGIPQSG